MDKQFTYLALGDSYTIGEAVLKEESFPDQLVATLMAKGLNVATPLIVAKTGWTTGELQEAIRSASIQQKFDLVTLLIGVNNQYRRGSPETYRKEFKALLQTAIDFTADASNVFVVSIPDWGLTPFGRESGQDTAVISKEIGVLNGINLDETQAAGANYANITPESRQVALNNTLTAADGLHPSAKMYQAWAQYVSKQVLKNIGAV